ncbi:MAG TPA: uracil phosphoribosyltransferase, partial [Longimicrobium sp.]|nr:uracil phosphoribosyltransferase [Longimicrobium sp.]
MTTYPNLTVVQHPLIRHKLAVLRDVETPTKQFKELVDEIAMLMAYEVTKDLPMQDVEIETPLETMTGRVIDGKKLVFV